MISTRRYILQQIIWWSVISLSLASCSSMAGKLQDFSDQVQASRGFVNEELQYAGYELKWRNVEGADIAEFKKEYEKVLGEVLAKRAPKVLIGKRAAKIAITASEVFNPNALKRALLPFQNPSIQIEVVVQDASTGEVLFAYKQKIVDILTPTGGITFRIGSIPSRLAGQTASFITGKLREDSKKKKTGGG